MSGASVAPLPTAEALPEHLRLALTYVAAKKFVEEELPKVGYTIFDRSFDEAKFKKFRSKYPGSLFWIAEQYGDQNTGYDLAEATKMWLRMNNAEDKSVCEVLKERGWEGVGEIEVFLSHVQAEHPFETLDALESIDCRGKTYERGKIAGRGPARKLKHDGSKVWVDYFCLRQLRNDFKPEQIDELIRKTGAVFVLMDGEETGSSYPTRSFTIFELSSAVKGKATLMIETPSGGPLAPPKYGCCPCCFDPCSSLHQGRCVCCDCCCYQGRCGSFGMPDYSIDAASANARRVEDKAMVEKFIDEGPGFARVNQVMERELRRNAVRYACNDAIACWCWPCKCMGCVEGPEPRCWQKMRHALNAFNPAMWL